MKKEGGNPRFAEQREALVKSAALWSGAITSDTFIGKASEYSGDIASIISAGLRL